MNIDDPLIAVHNTAYHSHAPGSKTTSEAEQYVNDQLKKQEQRKSQVAVVTQTDTSPGKSQTGKTYFLLSFIALALTVMIILAGCAGMVYFFLKLTRPSKEVYFQFDEEQRLPNIS